MSRKDRSGRHDPATAERVTSIIEAAERAAAALIDKADANAKRYLAEAEAEADRLAAARLEDLVATTDSLVAQAEAIRRESERLLEGLRRTGAQAGDEEAVADGPAAPRKHLAAVPSEPPSNGARSGPESFQSAADASDPDPEPTAPRAGRRSGNPAAARLLATQMAVSGSSREEIEARLRSGFEIEDTAPIIDAILGPES